MMAFKIAALYQFKHISDPIELKKRYQLECEKRNIVGALIIAVEGVNGTIAGILENMDEILKILMEDFENLELKFSFSEIEPFPRLRIRVKSEIVTMDFPLVQSNIDLTGLSNRGEYVNSKDWNQLISNPDVFILDTRNDYEISIGTFENSLNPNTKSFKEFPDYVEKNLVDKTTKIAMFCTGGVRCEKASAYLKSRGFNNVYHLKGGILKYLEDVSVDDSKFLGSCYVFDRRTSIDHGLNTGKFSVCFNCRHTLSELDINHPSYQEGIQCSYCLDNLTEKRKEAAAQRQIQIEIATKKQEKHLGMKHFKSSYVK